MSYVMPSRAVVFAAIFGGVVAAFVHEGQAVVIDSNTTIDADNSFPDESVTIVDGANPPTVVDILPGAVIGPNLAGNSFISVQDSSIVNMWGGFVDGIMSARDSSHVTIHGGEITAHLSALRDSTVELKGGTIMGGASVNRDATLNISGGSVGSGPGITNIVLSDSPTINIGGSAFIDGFIQVQSSPNGAPTINITGGEIRLGMSIVDSTTINWWGGTFPSFATLAFIGVESNDAVLNVYGTGLAIDEESGQLSGILADGTPADVFTFISDNSTATINLHEVTDTPGDSFPLDGTVDIDDLNQVRNHFGQGQMGGDPLPGDTFPFDGIVDVNDLNRIRNHFGATRPPTPVPEPAGAALIIIGIVALLSSNRSLR